MENNLDENFNIDELLSGEEVGSILDDLEGNQLHSETMEIVQENQEGEMSVPTDCSNVPNAAFHSYVATCFFRNGGVIQHGSGADGQEEEEPQAEEERMEEELMPLDVFNFPNTYFHLELRRTKSFKHREHEIVNEQSYTAQLRQEVITNDQATLSDIQPQLYLLFHSLLQEINNHYNPYDLVRVFITHEELVNTNIIVGPDYLGNMTADVIMNQVADVIRSNNFIPADQKLSINIAAIKNIYGLKMGTYVTDVWKDVIDKKCIISIANDDELCLPRSIAVALARLEYKQNPDRMDLKKKYETMRKKDRKLKKSYSSTSMQKCTALKYQKEAGIPLNAIGLLEHIPLYEKSLKIGITVISARGGNKKVYNGDATHSRQIMLYHIHPQGSMHGHFCVITSMTALLGRSYYCNHCDKGFQNNDKHMCEDWCNICGQSPCLATSDPIRCDKCHAPCRSMQCLVRHATKLGKYPSKCEQMMFCPLCKVCLKRPGRTGRPLALHTCGESYCSNCKKYYVNELHTCYMRAVGPKEGEDSQRFIFYDVESLLDENGEQVPNLIIAHSICSTCQEETMVTPDSRCISCGSRCESCNSRKGNEFHKKPCHTCGQREVMFLGPNAVSSFGAWLFSKQHKDVIAIAHNARAYDAYFLYNYIINNSMTPEMIFQGTKIMYCRVQSGLNITLLDSINFLNMPLSQLPKSFGLQEMKKGFFPHLYHIREHLEDPSAMKLDHHPPPKYYDIDSMRKSKREEFIRWYDQHSHSPFDFWTELIDYCRSDVNILLNACWKFRCLVMESTGPNNPIDPFNYVTIASVCMGIFRRKYLPEQWRVLRPEHADPSCHHEFNCPCEWTPALKPNGDSPLQWMNGNEVQSYEKIKETFESSPIGLLPPHGYARRDNYSVASMEWIAYIEQQYKNIQGEIIQIRTARHSSGEKCVPYMLSSGKIIHYKLDGYFVDRHGVEHALEFNGCWYHGCPSCFPRDRQSLRVAGKNLDQRYIDTMEKESRLREMGFVLHTTWACEFAQLIRSQPEVCDLINELEFPNPITIREAYFGGRTNSIQLHRIFSGNDKAGYLDFCSLYPYVLKYKTYPVGHPIRITSQFRGLVKSPCVGNCPYYPCVGVHFTFPYFGLVKAKVLPPRRLLFPILPIRCNNKLMFPLCMKCAREESQFPCRCTNEERILHHTWCTPEVEVAINMGYILMDVIEVLHWEKTSTINHDTGKGGLFTEYINTFLKLKAQASGYPKHVQTWKDKLAYVEQYSKHEGIHLDPSMIEFNPGLRSIAKLALNSFYGKFGQRTNMKKCAYINHPNEIYKLMNDYTKKICDMHVLNEQQVILEYTITEQFQEMDRKTNVMISAMCAAYARLRLWEVLNQLGERVLYHDTDSVIYSYTPTLPHPPIGSYLGDLADELTCKEVGCNGCEEGHWIVEFVGCGAKNYAYQINNGQIVCKVRGFCLNYSASQVVNMDSMRQVLYDWQNKRESLPMTTYKTMISRNKYTAIVYTHTMAKTYALVYNKRVVHPDFTTVPYGY